MYSLCVYVYCTTATGWLPNCGLQICHIIYHIISYHIISHISYHVISYHIIYHIISYHILSYHIISYHIISYHIISYHIISYHISYHIISYHVMSCHVMSYHIMSYHIISYHIISYHIPYHIAIGPQHWLRPVQKSPNLYRWPTYGNCLKLWKLLSALSLVEIYSLEYRGRWSSMKTVTWTCH